MIIPLLTGVEIALIALAIAALAAIVVFVVIPLDRLVRQWWYSRNPPAPTADGIAAANDLQAELQAIQSSGESPDAAKCKELWALYDRAISGDISQLRMAPILSALQAICGNR
ncbi:MAG: hypothetical protein AAGF94_12845 [Pseudomonadota bacterium]